MKGTVIAEVSVVPLGTGNTGLSRYVAACIDILNNHPEVHYQLTSMGTVIEGPMDKVIEVVSLMHEVPFSRGASRVLTTIKIDDRRDKAATMSGKVESVIKKLSKSGDK